MSTNTLLDPDSFAAHVAAATRQAGFVIEKREGLVLTVNVHGESMRCNLKTAYSAYQQSPRRLDSVVAAHLAALRQVPAPPPPLTEKEAAESLLPLLNPAAWLQAVRSQKVPLPIQRPFAGSLIVTYVFDTPQYRAYLNEDMFGKHFADAATALEEVHTYALQNLRKRVSKRDTRTYGIGDQTIVACEAKDGFAAARALLSELMAAWSERIPGRMLLGIPNRDFLIGFSDRDSEHVAQMAKQVRRDAAQREGPLSAELFVWQNGRVREFQPRH